MILAQTISCERSFVKDKSSVIAIVVVLGICCLGMYVAISGYFNSNPSALTSITPILQTTPVAITLPTDTPLPSRTISSQPIAPTMPPVPSPLGAFQTITAATTSTLPTLPPILPTLRPSPASSAGSSAPAQPSCAGFQYCWKNGVPDAALGPTGNECPRNYIWGLVTDVNGKGISNIRLRYRAPNNDVGETNTKDKPDVPGKYDVPAQSGAFVIWIVSGGAPASPQVNVLVQPYSAGSGVCLMRVDFYQQR